MDNQVFAYDKENTLSKNVFTKEGYLFKEWNTLSDGSGTSYSDEQEVINLANINEEIITLYAIWTPINYSVRFDANTGIGTMDNQVFAYDKENTLSKNTFVKEGYVFKEWNTKADGKGTKYKDEANIINLTNKEETITLYAIWRLDTLFDIDDYVLKDEKYITKIPDLVDKKTYLEKIYTDSRYSVKVFKMDNTELSNDDLIFTGSITKIMQNESVIAEFTNIVSGDVNGDGSISISDVAKVHSHVSKTNIMKEDYNLLAADVNASGDLTVSDTAKIFSYVKKTITDLRR